MTYDPKTATINPLNEIGYKIFLDRYAVKDRRKGAIKLGHTVVVCTNLETSQREVGTVTHIDGDQMTVKLRVDGSEVVRTDEHIDLPAETDPAQMHARLAKGMAAVEKTPKKRKEWEAKFRQILTNWQFIPGGRIQAGGGTKQALTYYNCYVLPSPKDSRNGIIDVLRSMNEVFSRGGGVGINLSSLRPRYDHVKGVNGRSSGAVSWGSLYSFSTGLIEQGGSRRGALMLILSIWHPDIEEFITSKTTAGKITNANISVGITDDFMDAVARDADWSLIFPDKTDPEYDALWDGNLDKWRAAGKKILVYKTVRARELWDTIIDSAWTSAEPGLFFMDRYNTMSPSSYYAPILCTNPCGEQGLPAWGVCNLGAVNLAQFTKPAFQAQTAHTVAEALDGVRWNELGTTIRTAVRFLDNVIDATPYFFEENRTQQLGERRVGLNTMGLAEMMVNLGIRYGSPEGNEFIDRLYEFFTTECYLASTQIAKEKGSFPHFRKTKHLETGFVKTLPESVRLAIKRDGLRNVTLNTQAPNGTIGTMVGTSTGIEPFYYWTYQRKSRLGMHEEKVRVYEEWSAAHPGEPTPAYFVTAMDLAPEEHIGVQAAIQRWLDSSISKTCNVPNAYTRQQVGELYRLMYDLGCKGGTVYRDGSRDVQILQHKVTASDSDALARQGTGSPETASALATAVGITPRKRPDVMRGSTYKVTTAYGKMYVTINEDEHGAPYEIFATLGKTGGFFAAKTEAISRLASLVLRSGVEVTELIDQLKGIRGPSPIWSDGGMILSVPDAIAQVLERHIKRNQDELALKFSRNQDQNLPPKLTQVKHTEQSGTNDQASDQTSLTQMTLTSHDVTSPTGQAATISNEAAAATQESLLQTTVTTTTLPTQSLANLGLAPACPTCGGNLTMREGCLDCTACGYSKCT
ncbi:adenosylcobalamin-dependent ribonucleoside-diphosphate reductase [Candidatus Berkelbacteria bacterium]|nr:adenosylcobalamin-dependent ribonucleoside-diphosphate reductase [Candidatus Berkelbacteria bacterium]